jgi:hypothetical protein
MDTRFYGVLVSVSISVAFSSIGFAQAPSGGGSSGQPIPLPTPVFPPANVGSIINECFSASREFSAKDEREYRRRLLEYQRSLLACQISSTWLLYKLDQRLPITIVVPPAPPPAAPPAPGKKPSMPVSGLYAGSSCGASGNPPGGDEYAKCAAAFARSYCAAAAYPAATNVLFDQGGYGPSSVGVYVKSFTCVDP